MIEFTIVAVLIAYCGLLLINRTIQHSRECLARENTSLTLRLDEANAVVVEACDSLEDAFRRESSMREEITRLTVRLNESEELRAKESEKSAILIGELEAEIEVKSELIKELRVDIESQKMEIIMLTVCNKEIEEKRANERCEHLKLKEFYSRSTQYLDMDLAEIGGE